MKLPERKHGFGSNHYFTRPTIAFYKRKCHSVLVNIIHTSSLHFISMKDQIWNLENINKWIILTAAMLEQSEAVKQIKVNVSINWPIYFLFEVQLLQLHNDIMPKSSKKKKNPVEMDAFAFDLFFKYQYMKTKYQTPLRTVLTSILLLKNEKKRE